MQSRSSGSAKAHGEIHHFWVLGDPLVCLERMAWSIDVFYLIVLNRNTWLAPIDHPQHSSKILDPEVPCYKLMLCSHIVIKGDFWERLRRGLVRRRGILAIAKQGGNDDEILAMSERSFV